MGIAKIKHCEFFLEHTTHRDGVEFQKVTFFDFFAGQIGAAAGCPHDNISEPDAMIK